MSCMPIKFSTVSSYSYNSWSLQLEEEGGVSIGETTIDNNVGACVFLGACSVSCLDSCSVFRASGVC